jgi:16S rRNA (uracil1498-N3)-methyltransferase
VAQALPKPDRGELAVDLMTEVGVDEIMVWVAGRSQVNWTGQRGDKARVKWLGALNQASKQSRRLRFPVLTGPGSWRDVVDRLAEADRAIIMDERATTSIRQCSVPSAGRVVIVIGPEGGLTDQEIDAFEAGGGQTYLMGETVLRTSTAGAIAVAQIRLLAQMGSDQTGQR